MTVWTSTVYWATAASYRCDNTNRKPSREKKRMDVATNSSSTWAWPNTDTGTSRNVACVHTKDTTRNKSATSVPRTARDAAGGDGTVVVVVIVIVMETWICVDRLGLSVCQSDRDALFSTHPIPCISRQKYLGFSTTPKNPSVCLFG